MDKKINSKLLNDLKNVNHSLNETITKMFKVFNILKAGFELSLNSSENKKYDNIYNELFNRGYTDIDFIINEIDLTEIKTRKIIENLSKN
jgi:hypothetical protein